MNKYSLPAREMEKRSDSAHKQRIYLPVRQFSNRGRSLSPDKYPHEQIPSPFTDTSSRSVFKLSSHLVKADSVLVEQESKSSCSRPHQVLTRRSTTDSILLPPPTRRGSSFHRSQAELPDLSHSQLPFSYITSPKSQDTCSAPIRHHVSSGRDKTRPLLPQMRIVKTPSPDMSLQESSNFAEWADLPMNNEPVVQFESTLDDQEDASVKSTHSDSIQTSEEIESAPLLNYDPTCVVEEELLPLLALAVGDELSSLTVNLHLSMSVYEQAKETYSLPDTQALYILRIWMGQKVQKMCDLVDALDRTGLKEVVSWAKAGRLQEFLHMKQKRRELRQTEWVSRFSTSVRPDPSAAMYMERLGNNSGKDVESHVVSLSQEALQRHDAIMGCSTSNDISTID